MATAAPDQAGRLVLAVPLNTVLAPSSWLGEVEGAGALLRSGTKMSVEVKAFFLLIGNHSLTTQLLGSNDSFGLIIK